MKPHLHRTLHLPDFNAWYWLKTELKSFCSQNGLSTAGSKEELQQRVRVFLAGVPGMPASTQAPRCPLPAVLTLETVIQPGWPLSRELRQFFVAHTGTSFRFNQVLRDIFKAPHGNTLGHALALYRASKQRHQTSVIGRQFQFNQHIRTYYQTHPQGSREEALRHWERMKQTRGSLGQSQDDEGD